MSRSSCNSTGDIFYYSASKVGVNLWAPLSHNLDISQTKMTLESRMGALVPRSGRLQSPKAAV